MGLENGRHPGRISWDGGAPRRRKEGAASACLVGRMTGRGKVSTDKKYPDENAEKERVFVSLHFFGPFLPFVFLSSLSNPLTYPILFTCLFWLFWLPPTVHVHTPVFRPPMIYSLATFLLSLAPYPAKMTTSFVRCMQRIFKTQRLRRTPHSSVTIACGRAASNDVMSENRRKLCDITTIRSVRAHLAPYLNTFTSFVISRTNKAPRGVKSS